MKKVICLILAVSVIALAFYGCGAGADYATGEWKFSEISDMEIYSLADESLIEDLKKQYSADSTEAVEEAAKAEFISSGLYDTYYLNFDGDRAYSYDPVMERESTWAFYSTADNEGFLSVYTDLDVADGNPDPITNPVVSYDAESDSLYVIENYAAFMVTLKLSRVAE